MSTKKFIPELHDIGKLVDGKVRDNLKIKTKPEKPWEGHVFCNFKFKKCGFSQPTSASWWGQYHHYSDKKSHFKITIDNINNWNLKDTLGNVPSQEDKYNLFLLILADHMASSVSRATFNFKGRGKSNQDGILKLWNRNFYQIETNKGKYWAAFKDTNDLKILFDEIENCKSGKVFLNKYKDSLLLTPEDKSIPKNVTSLYTHLKLVGKIYRVLRKNTKLVKERNGSVSVEYFGKKVNTIKEAEGGNRTTGNTNIDKGKWQARLAKCRIKFPHSFVRLRDLNLLSKKEECISNIVNRYEDEVIFASSDFIILFVTPNQDLKGIFKPLLDWNFYIEINETLADLGILNSILDKKILKARESNDKTRLNVLTSRNTKVYKKYLIPDIPEEITPPICEICQRRRGVERVKGTVTEYVCDKCQEIRDMGEPFKEYATVWEKEGDKVCWFKFSLDQDKLETWLQKTFKKYIKDNCNLKNAQDLYDEFRPLALQIDFNKDYKEMTEEFWKTFEGNNDIKSPVAGYYEVGVFKYSPELTKKVIETFLSLFERYFPDCDSDKNSPISLSLSITNIKYPIREHWRFFEKDSKYFMNIRYHKVFDENYTKHELENIINKIIGVETSSSFLHRLILLKKKFRSEIHINIEVFNNRKKYPEIYEAICKGIKPSKFLNLYRILKGDANG